MHASLRSACTGLSQTVLSKAQKQIPSPLQDLDVRSNSSHGSTERAGPNDKKSRAAAPRSRDGVDNGVAPGDRTPTRSLHNGVLGERTSPTSGPNIPGLHFAVPTGPGPPGLPVPRAHRHVAGDLPRRVPPLPGLRGGGDHGGAVPAVGVRAGRVRQGRRSRGSDVAWFWFGRSLAMANFSYFSINLLGFLIPRLLPRAFERYFRERDEVVAKGAEDHRSASQSASPTKANKTDLKSPIGATGDNNNNKAD
ncbi:hypothetical protein Syun_024539 [Stephania yunnanensis]|uniref:DUF7733 domain-containing protein n=1 Tax=Stephania yunnanensis TaxID=152371 RepID=A0AAP0I4M0_9MAGN